MRIVLLLAGALIAHGSFAACITPTAHELSEMSNDALRAAYCGARTQLSIESRANKSAFEANSGTQGGKSETGLAEARAAVWACYTSVGSLIKVLNERGIDIDDAAQRCDAPQTAALAAAPANAPAPAALPSASPAPEKKTAAKKKVPHKKSSAHATPKRTKKPAKAPKRPRTKSKVANTLPATGANGALHAAQEVDE